MGANIFNLPQTQRDVLRMFVQVEGSLFDSVRRWQTLESVLEFADTEEVTDSNPVRPTMTNPSSARIFTTPSLPRVPPTCPIEPPNLLRAPLNPALQLALYELAQTISDRLLASIAAMQIKRRRCAAQDPASCRRSALGGPRGARRATPAERTDQCGSQVTCARTAHCLGSSLPIAQLAATAARPPFRRRFAIGFRGA
jgi:hypothetical protein